MWLNFLTMLRRGCWAVAALMLVWSGNAAADINFNGSTPLPATCSLNSSSNTYTCASVTPVNWNDSIIIANGYTVIVTSDFAPGYNTGLTMSGTATLQTTGSNPINLGSIDPTRVLISGGTINAGGSFTPVSAGKTITANISAASVSASNVTINGTLKASTTISLADKVTVNGPIIAGALTTSGDYTNINGDVSVTGAINFGSNTTVKGMVGAGSITTNATSISGTLTANGAISLGSNTTIGGEVSGASITTNSSVTLSKSLTVTGTADLGSAIKISGNVTANAVKTGSPAQISGAIDSKTTIDLGSGTTVGGAIKGTVVNTGSPVTLNGAVTATTSFFLASGSSVTGNITSPSVTLASSSSTITGDITTTGKLDMGSSVIVTGTVKANEAILRASGARINGNATITGTLELQSGTTVAGKVSAATLNLRASNARIDGDANISGDVLLESGTSIGGNLNARNVDTKNGNAIISGNAVVNSIFIDGNNRVDGCITCIGAPSNNPYQCVTKPDWYNYTPKCSGASNNTIHHFQITHSGIGLTCQPQTVEIKACSDASCSATSTTATQVTLSPGGGVIDVSGTANAQVRYATATGTAGVTLSATAASVTGANVCPNAATNSNNCQMVFKDEGLVLNVPDHVSLDPSISLKVQALKTSAQGTCVPLVQGAAVPVKFSCAYINPLPASANPVGVTIGSTNLSCGGATTDVNLSFNSDGLATAALKYSEVGQTSLSASYSANALGASGAVQFATAPAKIKIEPIRINSPSAPFSGTAFAKASEPFKLRLTALNYLDNVTKNFGRESPAPQNFLVLPPVLTNPSGGQRPLTIGSYKGVADGVADAADGVPGQWHFDDTGTLEVTVTLDNSAGYLGKTTAGFKPAQKASLTFVPDHFDVTLLAGTPMDCAKTGLSNPCGNLNANGKFIYSMQPFNVEVSAYTGTKAPGNSNKYLPPQNYVGTAARPITLSAWTAADPNVAVPIAVGDFNWNKPQRTAVPFSFSYAAATPTTAEKTTGTVNSTLSALPSYDFNTRPTAPTTLFVRAIDSDGATSAGFAEPLLTVVSGQLEIGNISGPLTGTVPVTAKAQYWTGKTYVFNSRFAFDDPTQTQIPSQALTVPLSRTDAGVKTYFVSYANCKNGLYSGTANAPCAASAMPKPNSDSITFKNGVGTLRLNQPTPALTRNGSVDVALKNGADDLIKYLPSGTGTIIFGVYRSGPIIYMREAYN